MIPSDMKLAKDEQIIRKGHGNHLRGFEGVGGRFFLTDRRLYFKPHMFNRDTEDGSIFLDDIVGVMTKHSDLFSKKLHVVLKSGFAETFFVNRRREWVREIEKAIRRLEDGKGQRWYHSDLNDLPMTPKPTVSFGRFVVRLVILAFAVAFVTFVFLSLQE